MLILTIRTDRPEAELGLFDDDSRLAHLPWQAHRELSDTIHLKIKELLESQGRELKDLTGIVVFKGPGSFTGLRIGLSVANALAYGLAIPVVSETGDQWIETGRKRIKRGDNEKTAVPEYGSLPNITAPKK